MKIAVDAKTLQSKLDNAVTGQQDMILVPRVPTPGMLRAAKDSALAENAEWVWMDMIEEYERSEQRKLAEG